MKECIKRRKGREVQAKETGILKIVVIHEKSRLVLRKELC